MQSRWWLAGVLKQRQCSVGCCASVHNSRVYLLMLCCISQLLLHIFMNVWKLSATDVLVHMLMKGAAKCNNHCELQNSVNQLTIERRSALGAFLRACLCQCFHIFIVFYLSKMTVHQAILFDASSFVAAVLGACYLHCCEHDVDCFCEAHEHDIKQSNLLNLSI